MPVFNVAPSLRRAVLPLVSAVFAKPPTAPIASLATLSRRKGAASTCRSLLQGPRAQGRVALAPARFFGASGAMRHTAACPVPDCGHAHHAHNNKAVAATPAVKPAAVSPLPVVPASSHANEDKQQDASHSHAHGASDPPLSVAYVVEQAADLLPHQGILENFVHHNPLEHLQSMDFREAIEHVEHLESYMSPGERMLTLVNVDPRKRVNEALVDLSSAFLDRGAAKWAPQFRHRGFLYFFANLEGLGFAAWRRHARADARRIRALLEQGANPHTVGEAVLRENLEFFGIPPKDWENALRATMLELRGWAGMFRRMETHPGEAPQETTVRLFDFCVVQSILTRSSIEALAVQRGWDPVDMSFAVWLSEVPTVRPQPLHEAVPHASAIAFIDQDSERREALEKQVEKTVLSAINGHPIPKNVPRPRPQLQLYTCIDDRECSLRRHVEQTDPEAIETFGVAGFFGIPVRYQPIDGRDQMILAPEGQNPTAVLVERERMAEHEQFETYNRWRRFTARIAWAWEKASFSPIGSLALSGFFPVSIARLLLMGFSPRTPHRIKTAIQQKFLPALHTDFELPFPPEQAATLLARTFRDIGTHRRFAPVVVVLGHGAISVNNPFAAAYNCGACGGREGGPNARLLARFANDASVRAHLRDTHDIVIPDDTFFVGGLHNTTTDTIEFYDVENLPPSHQARWDAARQIIDNARGRNALERCNRFLLAKDVRTPEQALRHVIGRGTDAAEVRPELNHATNAAVVIGRRKLTKGLFLDRRAFLPSYDPYSDDAAGTNLEHVLAPALIVCSGINLEYLFSTIDVDHHGAGTKAPLNVVGNIGVQQGTSGDLRPGLPTQMTEMHIPVRALYVVDAPVERVEAVLSRRKDLRELVRNEWVRFFVRDPDSGQLYRQMRGEYVPVNEEAPLLDHNATFFERHRQYGMAVARREGIAYWTAALGMLASCAVPVVVNGAEAMNPHGSLVATSATLLALPMLAFSRRYLHGEYMFGRISFLSVGLLLGFNMVATAPDLAQALAGWSLFGFSSTFLIGAYNDRPTVRNNATFAFAAYRVADFAMLTAAAFAAHHPPGAETSAAVAGGLLLAALFKSSQFPLAALFVRSMEGPTPASALGYAGLSAHAGIVLLSSTMPLWYGFDWARLALLTIGPFTSLYCTLVAKIQSDRKGAIARATSATLGLIFVPLALGHPDIALTMSLGHAAFRMTQVLRAPNIIADTQNLRSALGHMPSPKIVSDNLYRLAWALRRVDTDFHLLTVLHRIGGRLHLPRPYKLTKGQQWLATGAGVVLAGAPFTPISHYMDHTLMEMLPTQPVLAGALIAGHFAFSVVLMRFLFVNVLTRQRFRQSFHKITQDAAMALEAKKS